MSYGNTIRNINTIRHINNARRDISYQTEGEIPEAKKDLGGAGWKIILSICLMKDFLLDPIKLFCLTGAQAIPVVGQALGGVVTVLVLFVGMLIFGTIMLYWYSNGVSVFFAKFKRNMIKKLFIKGLSLLGLFLDFLPFISILPWTSIYFYLNVRMENKDREEGRREREEYILAMNRKFG